MAERLLRHSGGLLCRTGNRHKATRSQGHGSKVSVMNCDEAKRRWHQQLDEGGRDDALSEHVIECASCARYAAQMQTIVCGLDELRIQSELGAASRSWDGGRARNGRRWRWFRPLAMGRAAAVIALCVGAYSWLVSGGAQRLIESGVAQRRAATTNGATPTPALPSDQVGWPQAMNLGMTLRGKSASRFLAVAQPTTSPDILMVRLYDTRMAGNPGFKPAP